MRNWIDAVPKEIQLPTMPGFGRDWADSVIDNYRAYAVLRVEEA